MSSLQREVMLDGHPLSLTPKEYNLLAILVQHVGEVVPREALRMTVWGQGDKHRSRTLDVHIRRLRKKLGIYAAPYIETIRGIGFRFQPFSVPRDQ